MGGWIAVLGDVKDASRQIKKFRSVFDIENVPKLLIDEKRCTDDFHTISWAWSNHGIPDIHIHSDADGNVLVVCGVITDLGKFGSVNGVGSEILGKMLRLWQQYGETFINQLNGSWSLLFFDARKRLAIAYTDRFASRSVWVSRDDNRWLLGNFPSALVAIRDHRTTFSPAGLWSLFQTSRHMPGKSLYDEISSLKAGQRIVLALDGSSTISSWWSRRYAANRRMKAKDWGYVLARALESSARRIKRTSENLYLFLSGGLDSRIAAASYREGIEAITLCTFPNFESRIATLVARNLRLPHHIVTRTPYWYKDTIKGAALITSGNYLINHTHFIVPVINIMERHPRAAFSLGDLLENLNKHYFSLSEGNGFSFTPERLPSLLIHCVPSASKDASRLIKIFRKTVGEYLQECWIEEVRESAKSVMDISEDDYDRFDSYLRWTDVSLTYTYNMITCIWPFASERTLFFDNELNDISLQIPSYIRGKGILHRWIMWFLNKRMLLLPDANSFLPPFMPHHLQEFAKHIRPTIGYFRRNLYEHAKPGTAALPTSGSWPLLRLLYARDKGYRSMIDSFLNNAEAFPDEIFDRMYILRLWNEYVQGNYDLFFEISVLITFGVLNDMVRCSRVSGL